MGFISAGSDLYDVFLSYASADNIAHNQWVGDFERYLRATLAAELARGVDLFVTGNIIIRLFFSKWNYILWQCNFFNIRFCQNIPTVIK
jgi:hypothetical protein